VTVMDSENIKLYPASWFYESINRKSRRSSILRLLFS
jgi:hypothetical protein